MFNGFDMNKMQEMLEHFSEQANKYQEQMSAKTYEGSAGAGMVKVKINGQMQVIDVCIDDEALEDKGSLQILLLTAFNDASSQATQALKGEAFNMFKGMQ